MTSPQMAKSQTYNFMVLSKNVLSGEEADLYELCNLAGITMDPHVFKIVLDLLRLNVAPMTILQVLKSMANSAIKSRSAGGDTEAAPSHTHKDTSNVSSSSDSSSRSSHRQPRTKTSHKLSYKGHKS